MRWTGGLLALVVAVTVVAAPAQGLAFMQTHDPLIGCQILTVNPLPPGADVDEDCLEPTIGFSAPPESSTPTNETQEDQA